MKYIRDILEPLFMCGLIVIGAVAAFTFILVASIAVVHCLQLICEYFTQSSTEHILPPYTYL